MAYEMYKPFFKNGKRYEAYGNSMGFTEPKAKKVLEHAKQLPDIEDAFIVPFQFNNKSSGKNRKNHVVLYRTKNFR